MATNQERVRSLSIFEEIDRRFAEGSVTAVASYIDSLSFPIIIEQSSNTNLLIDDNNDNALFKNTDIFLDNGIGRVSKGLRGLELLSKLCKGVVYDNLFLFNNVIYSSSPSAIKSASDDELIRIIISNLGMTLVMDYALSVSPSLVSQFNNLCLVIGKSVRSGVFNKDDYKTQVLVLSKKITLAASRSTTSG